MKVSEGSLDVSDAIRKAIQDGKITNSEFDKILFEAEKDGHIDSQEKSLLAQLHNMISEGTVKRVPD